MSLVFGVLCLGACVWGLLSGVFCHRVFHLNGSASFLLILIVICPICFCSCLANFLSMNRSETVWLRQIHVSPASCAAKAWCGFSSPVRYRSAFAAIIELMILPHEPAQTAAVLISRFWLPTMPKAFAPVGFFILSRIFLSCIGFCNLPILPKPSLD